MMAVKLLRHAHGILLCALAILAIQSGDIMVSATYVAIAGWQAEGL